jgi:Flp pilus assembly protein TadG
LKRRNWRSPRKRGAGLVEFALVAPITFLLLFGIVVVGIVVMDQVQLATAVRDSVRSAAVCGDDRDQVTRLPDGTACMDSTGNKSTNVKAYAKSRLGQFTVGVQAPTFLVYRPDHSLPAGFSSTDPMASCSSGNVVEISAKYQQNLYLPLIGNLLGDNGTQYRTITADAEATCQQ